MTEEEARQIVGEHTTDELRVIAAALSIRQAENTSFRGSEMDADWNDRVGFYCLSLILCVVTKPSQTLKYPAICVSKCELRSKRDWVTLPMRSTSPPLPMSKGTTAMVTAS